MGDNIKYVQRTIDAATALVMELLKAEAILFPYEQRVANVQCGKPGHGYKALRRHTQARRLASNAVAARLNAIKSWVSDNNKAPLPRRQQRQALIDELRQTYSIYGFSESDLRKFAEEHGLTFLEVPHGDFSARYTTMPTELVLRQAARAARA